MPTKIDVQDVKDRLLNGETPSQLADWYFEELGINVTRQAISQHRQKLVKEGKLQKGRAGRPPGSYIKKETAKSKTKISPTELVESLISIAKMADRAQRLEAENLLLRHHITQLEFMLRQLKLPFQPLITKPRKVTKESDLYYVPSKD